MKTRQAMIGAVLLGVSSYLGSASASVGEQPIASADRAIDRRVETALQQAPYLFSQHITVTSRDGVVTLYGKVGDPHDLRQALRIAGGVDGVRRVVNDLEIMQMGGRGR